MNHVGHNFMREMAEAYAALEREQGHKDRIAELEAARNVDLSTIQMLELRAIERRNELDILNERIRSLEVERDNAQFRGLELEEQLAQYRSFIGAFRVEADQLARQGSETVSSEVKLVDGPLHISPTVEQDAGSDSSATSPYVPSESASTTENVGSEGQSEGHPTASDKSGESGSSATLHIAESTENASQKQTTESSSFSIEGQSDGPFASTPATTTEPSSETPSPTAPVGNVENMESVSSPTQPKPYEGLLYTDYPNYVSLHCWLIGGGTEESYNYRHPTVHSGH